MLRCLAYDSGALRMGWGVIDGDGETAPTYVDSGILGFPQEGYKYQEHKLRIVQYWVVMAPAMFVRYKPDLICAETLPAVGFNNMTQAELAKAAIITVLAMAFERSIPVYQMSAGTVKKQIGGSKDASKVAVRNGVVKLLPVLEPRRMEWQESKKTMDEPDALGVGLTKLGYSIHKLG